MQALGCHLMVVGNQIRVKEMTRLELWSELVNQRWVQRASVHTQQADTEKLYRKGLQLAYDNTFGLPINPYSLKMQEKSLWAVVAQLNNR